MPKIQNILDSLLRRNERLLRVPLQVWMNFAQQQIRRDLTERYQKSAASKLTDWQLIQNQGVTTIKPAVLEIMKAAGQTAYTVLAVQGAFDVLNVPAVKAVNKFCSTLVTEVTKNTKKGINVFIKQGIKDGKSMPKIARELKPLVGLTSRQTQGVINYRKILEAKRPDFTVAQIDRAVIRYTNKTHRMRMENIARTETARAQNIGYCKGLEEVGVGEVELSNAFDACEICEELNGKRYKVGEGADVIPVHPRCRCAMLPVIDDKMISEMLRKPPLGLEKPAVVPKPTPKPISLPKPKPEPKLTSKEWVSGLSKKERQAYMRWTLTDCNEIRRYQLGDKTLKQKLTPLAYKKTAEISDDLLVSMERAPNFKGTLYRGITSEEKFEVGNIKQYKSIASASSKKATAMEYSEMWADSDGQAQLLYIKARTGVDLSEFTGTTLSEVLIRKDTSYKVVKKVIDKKNRAITNIFLEEL